MVESVVPEITDGSDVVENCTDTGSEMLLCTFFFNSSMSFPSIQKKIYTVLTNRYHKKAWLSPINHRNHDQSIQFSRYHCKSNFFA